MKSIGLAFFLILTVNYSFAQPNQLDKYTELASLHYKNNNYDACIELCERILFFDTQFRHYSTLGILMADAYNKKGDYRNAALKYNNAYNFENNEEEKNEIIFKCALNYYLSGDTIFAYSEMYNIDENKLSAEQKDKFHLIMATLDYKTCRYNSSLNHFLLISGLSQNDKKFIIEKFNKTRKINRKYNPLKVEWMSILPGLGQLWCGNYKESLNAFLITSACYALFINVSINYDLLDGILVVYPWFNRYYKGGVIKSYHIAEKKREAERNKILNSIISALPEMDI